MQIEKNSLDALVIGAGPVGLVAASELARHGARVRIVDRTAAPSSTSKALAIFPRTLEVFAAMGIAEKVIEAGQKLNGLSIYDEKGSLAHLSFEDLPTPYSFAVSLPQSHTERILIEHLETLGITVERRVELTGFTQGGDGVRAVLRHTGGEEDPAEPAREETVETPWLLGCDGAHSTVRHLLEVPFEGGRYEESFILADVKIEGPLPADAAHLFFSAEGVLAIFPFGGGRCRVIANIHPPADAAAPAEPVLADFQAVAEKRGARATRFSDPVWFSRFNISHRKVKAFRHGRVFLAGDAAHIHSPAGGQGMNTGIQDAFNLAWKLALVARAHSPDSLLESYNAEREPVARGVLSLTDRLTRMATLRNPLARQVRNLVLPLVASIRKMETRIAQQIAELAIHYRRSPAVEDHAHGGETRAGNRAPDAFLQQGGKTVRLFELFRDTRHVLLHFKGEPTPEEEKEIAGLRRDIETSLSGLIAFREIAGEDGAAALVDETGAAAAGYGCPQGGIVLVRPDGYIGFRSDLANAGKLRHYLAGLFDAGRRIADAPRAPVLE